jgi:hypothetical protein
MKVNLIELYKSISIKSWNKRRAYNFRRFCWFPHTYLFTFVQILRHNNKKNNQEPMWTGIILIVELKLSQSVSNENKFILPHPLRFASGVTIKFR